MPLLGASQPQRSASATDRAAAVRLFLTASLLLAFAGDALSDEVTLRQALDRALRESPVLKASTEELKAREAHAVQEGLPPNPVTRLEIENLGGSGVYSGAGTAETTLAVSQLFETAGKRGKHRAAALGEEEVALRQLGVERLEVAVNTTKAFVEALAMQERFGLIEQLFQSSRGAVQLAQNRVSAGSGSPVDSLRAEAQLRQLEAARARLARQLEGARVVLAANWGEAAPPAFSVRGDLYTIDRPPAAGELLKTASQTAGVRRAEAEVTQRGLAVEVENARGFPDVTAGIGARRFEVGDDGALVLELSVPLPLLNRNQGGIAEARRRYEKARWERDKAIVSAEAALRVAYAALFGAFDEAAILRDRTIPKAESALRGAVEGYRRGLLTALDVLDSRRTLYEVRLQYIDALSAYHSARADVDRWSALRPSQFEPLTETVR